MKKLLFIAFIFITTITHAQKVGVYDKNITATDTLEAEQSFIVSNDTIVPILDVAYIEYSTDGVSWSKDTTGANYMRISVDVKNTWKEIDLDAFDVYWEVSGDSLKPVGAYLITGDSIYGGKVSSDTYFLGSDTLSLTNIYSGSGVDNYVLTRQGDVAVWLPQASGSGAVSGRNVNANGIGVFQDTLGSELQFRGIYNSDGFIDLSLVDSTIVLSWDGSNRTITAGVGISGGGALDNDITINLYIPELLQTTSLQGNLDYAVVYDNSVAGHRKVLTQEFYPDLYVSDALINDNSSLFNFKAGDGLTVLGSGSAVQYTADPIVLRTDGTTQVARVDTIDIIGGSGINIAYSDNGKITISTTPSGLPTCEEGEFLAVVGGEWACVNPCDYICSDTIINIINNYNDTASVIQPSGDVVINFSRLDCEDSTQILATDLAKTTLNLTSIKIVTAPTAGELHYNGVAVINGQELSVTSGSLDTALYYVSDASTGSAYVDGFNFQLLYSSNASYLGEANVNVSIDACVTESVCFGYLYNGYTVSDTRELTSSAEWSVPTTTQYNDLVTYLGGYLVAGGKLKTTGTIYWNSPNTSATNEYGFNGIGGGYRSGTDGTYSSFLNSGRFRSTSGDRPLDLAYSSAQGFVNNLTDGTESGFSIRLVSDATGLPDGTTTTYTGNDGKIYNAVAINELYWTTENLEETQYRNGDEIPNVTDNTTWANLTTGALCLYDNDLNNACKTPLPETIVEYITLIGNNDYAYISSDGGSSFTQKLSSSGWTTNAMDSTGQYQAAVGQSTQIYVSSDYGNSWTAKESSLNYNGVDVSNNGQYMTATVYGGNIYTSSDYGDTWTSRETTRNWRAIAISESGEHQTSAVYGGQIYLSSDYGVTWSAVESSRNYQFMAMNSSGKYQTIVVKNGQIYVSSDYGATWTAKESNRDWYRVAMSSSGQYQTAVNSAGFIYISSDYGDTWGEVGVSKTWRGVAMNATGEFQYAVNSNVSDNRYVSYDYGQTWTMIGTTGSTLFSVDVNK